MKKFDIEMAVGYCANLTVEAENQQEAIKKAKELVYSSPVDYLNSIEIEDINYIGER